MSSLHYNKRRRVHKWGTSTKKQEEGGAKMSSNIDDDGGSVVDDSSFGVDTNQGILDIDYNEGRKKQPASTPLTEVSKAVRPFDSDDDNVLNNSERKIDNEPTSDDEKCSETPRFKPAGLKESIGISRLLDKTKTNKASASCHVCKKNRAVSSPCLDKARFDNKCLVCQSVLEGIPRCYFCMAAHDNPKNPVSLQRDGSKVWFQCEKCSEYEEEPRIKCRSCLKMRAQDNFSAFQLCASSDPKVCRDCLPWKKEKRVRAWKRWEADKAAIFELMRKRIYVYDYAEFPPTASVAKEPNKFVGEYDVSYVKYSSDRPNVIDANNVEGRRLASGTLRIVPLADMESDQLESCRSEYSEFCKLTGNPEEEFPLDDFAIFGQVKLDSAYLNSIPNTFRFYYGDDGKAVVWSVDFDWCGSYGNETSLKILEESLELQWIPNDDTSCNDISAKILRNTARRKPKIPSWLNRFFPEAVGHKIHGFCVFPRPKPQLTLEKGALWLTIDLCEYDARLTVDIAARPVPARKMSPSNLDNDQLLASRDEQICSKPQAIKESG